MLNKTIYVYHCTSVEFSLWVKNSLQVKRQQKLLVVLVPNIEGSSIGRSIYYSQSDVVQLAIMEY